MANIPVRDTSRYAAEQTTYASWEDFLSTEVFDSGLHCVPLPSGLWLDMLVKAMGAPTTFVMFNGAGFPSDGKRPGFSVTGVIGAVQARHSVNAVFVHDPTLYAAPELSLAWYSGTRYNPAQAEIQEAIDHVLSGIKGHGRACYFGVSGGGFAALLFGRANPGSLIVPVIPQVRLQSYADWALDRWLTACWGAGADKTDPGLFDSLGIVGDLTAVDAFRSDVHVLVLSNSADSHHIESHLGPLVDARAASGLSTAVVIRRWGEGHSGPPPDYFVELFLHIAGAVDWATLQWGGSACVSSAEEVFRLQQACGDPVVQEFDLSHAEPRAVLSVPVSGTLDVSFQFASRAPDGVVAIRWHATTWDGPVTPFSPKADGGAVRRSALLGVKGRLKVVATGSTQVEMIEGSSQMRV